MLAFFLKAELFCLMQLVDSFLRPVRLVRAFGGLVSLRLKKVGLAAR